VNQVVIPIKSERKPRTGLKDGCLRRGIEGSAGAAGEEPRRRELLIEHLHKIQDCYGRLSGAHLVALAAEMKLALAEVYEVASFYHHFDVVKDGAGAPAPITCGCARRCRASWRGRRGCSRKLPGLLGREVRVLAAPCVGRCEAAPVVVVGQNPWGTRRPKPWRSGLARRR